MPTPVGHALAGLTIAWSCARSSTVAGEPARPGAGPFRDRLGRADVRLAAACVLLAIAPDLDILFAVHRAAWHSLTAALIVGFAVFAVMAARGARGAARAGVACMLAWASHVGLDWLGRDTSPPQGVMAFWPLSQAYFESGLGAFAEVSRRYWKPDEFIWGNLQALVRELAILAPFAVAAWLWGRRRAPQ